MIKFKCPDCDGEVTLPDDFVDGELLSCPSCGLEIEVKQFADGKIDAQPLVIEGEDWGE